MDEENVKVTFETKKSTVEVDYHEVIPLGMLIDFHISIRFFVLYIPLAKLDLFLIFGQCKVSLCLKRSFSILY